MGVDGSIQWRHLMCSRRVYVHAAVGRVRRELTHADIDGRFAEALLAPTLAELVLRVRRALGVRGPWEAQGTPLLDGVERLLELPVPGRTGRPVGGRFVLDQTSAARSARLRGVARTVPGARSTYLAGHHVAAEARSLGYATRQRLRLWRRPDERERTSRQAPRAKLTLTVAADGTAELVSAAARHGLAASDRGYGVYLDAPPGPRCSMAPGRSRRPAARRRYSCLPPPTRPTHACWPETSSTNRGPDPGSTTSRPSRVGDRGRRTSWHLAGGAAAPAAAAEPCSAASPS